MTGIKKSAIIAFLELCKAVEAGDQVFLLRSSDIHASGLMQEYDDLIHTDEDEEDTAWKQYVSNLTAKFATVTDAAPLEAYLPEKAGIQHWANVLAQVTLKVLHPTSA